MSLSRLFPPSPTITCGRRQKLDEEYRNIFPILNFPNEILFKIYPNFDLASRRALRINGRLAGIEKEAKYGYKRLRIEETDADDQLLFFGEDFKIPFDHVKILHSDLKKELVLLRKHTHFYEAHYSTVSSVDRRYINVMNFIDTKTIGIRDFESCDLESVVRYKEFVTLDYESSVTGNGIAWVLEKMRDRQVDLAIFQVKVKKKRKTCGFSWRDFNRETLIFSTTNPNQRVAFRRRNEVVIKEGNLEINVEGIKANENEEIFRRDANHKKSRFVQIRRK